MGRGLVLGARSPSGQRDQVENDQRVATGKCATRDKAIEAATIAAAALNLPDRVLGQPGHAPG